MMENVLMAIETLSMVPMVHKAFTGQTFYVDGYYANQHKFKLHLSQNEASWPSSYTAQLARTTIQSYRDIRILA